MREKDETPGWVPVTRAIELAPPHVGARHAPLPLAGSGSLTLEEDALVVTASRLSKTWISHVVLASVLFFGVGGPLVFEVIGLGKALGTTLGIALVGGLVAWAVKRGRASKGVPMTVRVPRSNVRTMDRDPHTECLVIVVAGMSPSGGIFVCAPPDSILEEELRSWFAWPGSHAR